MHEPIILSPFSPPIASELGRRLRQVKRSMNAVLARCSFPPSLLADLRKALKQPRKLFYSQAASGGGITDEDSGLWSLHVILAHAAASHTDAIACPIRNWRPVASVAAAGEFLGIAFDIIDDVQDGDGPLVTEWGIPLAVQIGATFMELARASLDSPDIPTPLKASLHATLSSAILASASGQYLDLIFEHRKKITLRESLNMTEQKSGPLFGLLYQIGALVGAFSKMDLDCSLAVSEGFARFGFSAGVMFQIHNDQQDSGMSEPSKSDRVRGKKTIPLVMEAEMLQEGASIEAASIAAARISQFHLERHRLQAQELLEDIEVRYNAHGRWLRWLLM